jgi:hypothetical protein
LAACSEYKILIPVVETVTATPEDEDERERAVRGAWREVTGTWTAPNDIAAIKLAEKEHGPFDFGAVAIPVRSWRPRTPRDETIPRRLWT